MNKILIISLLLTLTGLTNAEQSNSEKIASLLTAKLTPHISDSELSDTETKRRIEYEIRLKKLMAKHLEEEMTAEEIQAVLEYLQSPVGMKFNKIIYSPTLTEGMNEVIDEYLSGSQN